MRAVLQYHTSRVLRRDHRDLGWISVVSQTKSFAVLARGLSREKGRTDQPDAHNSQPRRDTSCQASLETRNHSRNTVSADYMKCTVEEILPETRQVDTFVEGSSCGQTNRLEPLSPNVGKY